MSKKNILHMISPQENVSPFDVNMACDAGYDVVDTLHKREPNRC